MNPNQPLSSFAVTDRAVLAQPRIDSKKSVTVDSPALDVLSDLTLMRAATIHHAMQLRSAADAMAFQNVNLLFVASDLPQFEGLITTTDLHGEKQVRVMRDRNLRYEDLTVDDVMTRLADLDAVAFDQVRIASVGNIIATLQHLGRNHILVVQPAADNQPAQVCGLFSRARIEELSGLTINITPIASSFADIERALL